MLVGTDSYLSTADRMAIAIASRSDFEVPIESDFSSLIVTHRWAVAIMVANHRMVDKISANIVKPKYSSKSFKLSSPLRNGILGTKFRTD